jgi:peptide/nickel transport system ATP-binding protein
MSPDEKNFEPLLSVRNLKTHFLTEEGTVKAVDGITFDVFPSRTLGILGESGCGKTVTALSILRIVERPGRIVEGNILLQLDLGNGHKKVVDLARLDANGKEMRSIRGREIALIFQEPMTSLSIVHTIGNQIIEAIRIHQKVSKGEARQIAIDLLEQVGISQPKRCIDEYPFQLSGGMRQRAMIAMALSSNPKILIADEPTTALDVTTQAQILELLRDLQVKLAMAVILITHNMGVIAEMSNEVAVTYLGRVVEKGEVDDIFHAAKHPYTQTLLRSIPSIVSRPRTKLPTITGSIPHPYNRPSGCSFHPRCPEFISGKCDQHEPSLLTIGDNHQVSCFLYHREE